MNSANETAKRKILITGGCGRIGSHFARSAAGQYSFRIVDKIPWDVNQLGPLPGESLVLDLQNMDDCRKACDGMDVVIHLAADPDPEADFCSSLLGNNVLASYNIFSAAKASGCQRLIFASSIHAVGAYPQDVQIRDMMPVQPTTMYGVSKCFGEALAAHFAVNEGLPSIAIRIGAYLFPDELDVEAAKYLDAYLHPDDMNQLLTKCIETPDINLAIIYAISDNHYKRVDLTETRRLLGYRPQWDGFALMGLLPHRGSG